MYQVIIVVHVFLGLGVIGLVLMQQGKGADAGAAFAGGSGSVFGAQGASSFLSRTTAILAAAFFATSLGLAVLSGYQNKPDDLMDEPVIEQPLEDVPLIGDREVVNTAPVADTPIIVPDKPVISDAPVVPDTGKVEEATTPVIDAPVVVPDAPVVSDAPVAPDTGKVEEATTPVIDAPVVVPDAPVVSEDAVVVPDTVKVEEVIAPTEAAKTETPVTSEATVNDIASDVAPSTTPSENVVKVPAETATTEKTE